MWRIEVIDRAIDKLLATEIERAHAERRDLDARLANYEKRYNMSSKEFYRRFRAGELGDGMDFVEWSVFYEMQSHFTQHSRQLYANFMHK